MKHVYSRLLSFLCISGLGLSGPSVLAQSPSLLSNGNCAVLKSDFNSNSGDLSSPSIHSNLFDEGFYYDAANGLWTEFYPGRTTAPAPGRTVSIISLSTFNPNPPTMYDVGFSYKTSNATTDRFQIRILEEVDGADARVIASTGLQTFSSWSTPTTIADAGNPLNSGDTGHVCIHLLDNDLQSGPGIFYRVEIAYIVTGATYASFDNFSIGGETGAGPLPVSFIGIAGVKVNEGIMVRWDVGGETDVKEYQLEKSTDGSSFATVGTVAANNKTVYSFTDRNIKLPALFYRVKSVDLNGTVKYSGIVRMRGDNSYSNKLSVYPSPARTEITVQHSKLEQNAVLTIATMDGRVIRSVTPARGASNTMVNISALQSGMYILRIENGNGKVESSTFVKQ